MLKIIYLTMLLHKDARNKLDYLTFLLPNTTNKLSKFVTT